MNISNFGQVWASFSCFKCAESQRPLPMESLSNQHATHASCWALALYTEAESGCLEVCGCDHADVGPVQELALGRSVGHS